MHHEFGIISHTATNWKHLCRDVCATHFVANPVAIGGAGVTVEIYESLFCRRKHNVGRQVTEQWVFGGVEMGTLQRRRFLVPVDRRDAAILPPVLQQYVLPGTTAVSDCWRAYNTACTDT